MVLSIVVSSVGGVYVFVFRVARDFTTSVGSLGTIYFQQGVYGYIGSARGAGGVRSRVLHHIRKRKRLWWHIDYLTVASEVLPLYIVYAETSRDVEPFLAQEIGLSPCWSGYVKGFGSSDKNSSTHLYLCRCCENLCITTIADVFRAIGLKPTIERIDSMAVDSL